jgi:hypothetical protein
VDIEMWKFIASKWRIDVNKFKYTKKEDDRGTILSEATDRFNTTKVTNSDEVKRSRSQDEMEEIDWGFD